jgi:hypothetical protein
MTRDLLAILNTKSCSGCTKCCEGYLLTNIKGHNVSLGNPCPFVIKDVGCNDYQNRPLDPCSTFQCEWRRNPYFDEWLSPVNSQALFTRQVIEGITYLSLSEAGMSLNAKVLTWGIDYAKTHQVNFCWSIDDHYSWVGSLDFCKAMERRHKNQPAL